MIRKDYPESLNPKRNLNGTDFNNYKGKTSHMKRILQPASALFRFYYDGFRNMSLWGRKVWIIILIKLFVIFLILKLFFFHDFLKSRFENDEKRGTYVLEQLTNTSVKYD